MDTAVRINDKFVIKRGLHSVKVVNPQPIGRFEFGDEAAIDSDSIVEVVGFYMEQGSEQLQVLLRFLGGLDGYVDSWAVPGVLFFLPVSEFCTLARKFKPADSAEIQLKLTVRNLCHDQHGKNNHERWYPQRSSVPD